MRQENFDSSSIGLRIKSLRELKKLSVKTVSERMSITRQALYDYESGKRVPPMKKLTAFAELFSVPLNEIIEGGKVEPDKNETKVQDSLLEELDRLKKQNAQLIENNTLLIQLLRDSGVQLGKQTDLKATKGELHPEFYFRAFQVKNA